MLGQSSLMSYFVGVFDLHCFHHSVHSVEVLFEVEMVKFGFTPASFLSDFFPSRPLIPLSVVGREGSAGGVVCLALLPAWQGGTQIARRNREFAIPNLLRRLLSGLPRSLPSPQ